MGRSKEKGQAILLVLVAMSILLLGAIGLAIDGSQIWAHRQMAQNAADAAAQAGIMSLFNGTNTGANAFGAAGFSCVTATDARTPCVFARANGFGVNADDTVAVDFPTAAPGVTLSDSDPTNLIRVTIARTLHTGLIQFLGSSTATVRATATAAIVDVVSPVPIIITHPTLDGSFSINGTPTIKICGGPSKSIQVNSDSATSIITKGGSNTVDLSKAGPNDDGFCNTGTGADFGDFGGPGAYPSTLLLGTTGHYLQPASPIQDPLKDVPQPGVPGANGTKSPVTGPDCGCPTGQSCQVYHPGLYQTGITIKNEIDLFAPGLYYTQAGGFNMLSNSAAWMAGFTQDGAAAACSVSIADPDPAVYGGGMVVFNSGDAKADVFNFDANAGTAFPIKLVGTPSSSFYKGILFFEDRTAAAHLGTGPSPGHLLQGGGIITLKGTIYTTNTLATMESNAGHYQNLSLQGNPGSTTTIIGEIITGTLNLGGTAGINMQLDPDNKLHIRQVALVK